MEMEKLFVQLIGKTDQTTSLTWLIVSNGQSLQAETVKEFISEAKSRSDQFDINEKISCAHVTALHWAVSLCTVEVVKVLVNFGADVHAKDALGLTPLFYCACDTPDVEMVRFLVEKCKAKPDERDMFGSTCLHGAAKEGYKEIVKLLLSYGVDPRVCDHEGTTPFDAARHKADILKILHKANSEKDSKQDKQGQKCANCGDCSATLKRCGGCQVVLYCGQDCQKIHWKEGNHRAHCEQGVLAGPSETTGYQLTIMNVLPAERPTVAIFGGAVDEYLHTRSIPAQRFVVKVQIPIPLPFAGSATKDLMVYNVDRSVDLFIKETTPGYKRIVRKIKREGICGLKAYFWAQSVPGKSNTIKVFPGKLAPTQEW